ncbi:hypothetical protein EC973_003776 [Apophysomyces ossiformis]|uniref:Non-homologous end-joining factor 1 n=1 Tax=Apophysomyces ossiformis TaxID=679940 RepID=A0A8H7EKX5_9FUNG|nr:hypothetical protein EC973_003776 [Apophysomyces ossiformis]
MSNYYVKIYFGFSEYLVLISDLRTVWFERGDASRIMERAQRLRFEVETAAQISSLLRHLSKFFDDPSKCRLQMADGKISIHCDSLTGVMGLYWPFLCEPLDKETGDESTLGGPTVLYEHFILPMITVANATAKVIGTKLIGAAERRETLPSYTQNTQIFSASQMTQSAVKNTQDASIDIERHIEESLLKVRHGYSERQPPALEPSWLRWLGMVTSEAADKYEGKWEKH